MPAWHWLQDVAPSAALVPAAQVVQTVSLDAVQAALMAAPAGHVEHLLQAPRPPLDHEPAEHLAQLALPATAEVPTGQLTQTASLVAVHAGDGKKPALHVLQGAQLVEPSVAAKVELVHAAQGVALPAGLLVPGAQKEHCWSAVALPMKLMYLPAVHCDTGTHAAERADAA